MKSMLISIDSESFECHASSLSCFSFALWSRFLTEPSNADVQKNATLHSPEKLTLLARPMKSMSMTLS